MIDALPAGECVCAGQASHVDSNITPVSIEYFPGEQSEQIDAPLCIMYLPGPHDEHVDRASVLPYLPASQFVHAEAVEAPEIR